MENLDSMDVENKRVMQDAGKRRFFAFLRALLEEFDSSVPSLGDKEDWRTLTWSVKLKTSKFIEYAKRFSLAEIISETNDGYGVGKSYRISTPMVMGSLMSGTISVTQDIGDNAFYDWRRCLLGGKRNSLGHIRSRPFGYIEPNAVILHDYSYKIEDDEYEIWREHSIVISYAHQHCVNENTGRGFFEKALLAPLGDDDSMIYNIIKSKYDQLNE